MPGQNYVSTIRTGTYTTNVNINGNAYRQYVRANRTLASEPFYYWMAIVLAHVGSTWVTEYPISSIGKANSIHICHLNNYEFVRVCAHLVAKGNSLLHTVFGN